MSSSLQEEKARLRLSKNLNRTLQNPRRRRDKISKGNVTMTSKLERGRTVFLKLMLNPESEAQAKTKQLNVQDEVKRLAPNLAKLNWNEWMAIVGHLCSPKSH